MARLTEEERRRARAHARIGVIASLGGMAFVLGAAWLGGLGVGEWQQGLLVLLALVSSAVGVVLVRE